MCGMHKLLPKAKQIFVHLHLSDTYENKIIGGRSERDGNERQRKRKKMAKIFIRYTEESEM